MTEAEAREEAKRLNLELGAKGGRDARRYYYLEVRQADGEWTVERQEGTPKGSWWDAFVSSLPFGG